MLPSGPLSGAGETVSKKTREKKQLQMGTHTTKRREDTEVTQRKVKRRFPCRCIREGLSEEVTKSNPEDATMGHMRDGGPRGPLAWEDSQCPEERAEEGLHLLQLGLGVGASRRSLAGPGEPLPGRGVGDGVSGQDGRLPRGCGPGFSSQRLQVRAGQGPRTRLDRSWASQRRASLFSGACQPWGSQTKVSGQRSQRSAPANIHFVDSENTRT